MQQGQSSSSKGAMGTRLGLGLGNGERLQGGESMLRAGLTTSSEV